jgi:hypothetical protein
MAAPQAQSGFVVSPIYQNVSIGAQQAQAHYEVTLSNSTAADQSFKLSTVDFGSLNDSGGVAFLGSSTSSFSKKYGLSGWMKLDSDTVAVPQGKSVQIGVSILNSDTLTAGGHYGAILATALTAPDGPAVQPRVGVFEVLSSLLLLIKQGGATPSLSVTAQSADGGWWRMPSSVTDRFQNSGNVHVVPRGVVEVKDPLGKVVMRGSINENSGIILPQMYRKYATPLMAMEAAWVPGRYSVVLSYRFDGTNSTKIFATGFWFLGRWGIAAVGVLLIFVLVSLGLWLVPRYKPVNHKRKGVRAKT